MSHLTIRFRAISVVGGAMFLAALCGLAALGSVQAPAPPLLAAAQGDGYALVAGDGGVFPFGSAQFHGALGNRLLNQPIVGIAATPSERGYWLVARDGGVFAFGDARFFGSLGSLTLNQPIVGIAGTSSGRGYWLVARDGGIFAFGDARFFGSLGALALNGPIVGIAGTSSGRGYWLVAGDGGIFAFGEARFFGSLGAVHLNAPVVGIDATPTGAGYWMATRDGGVFPFGDAKFFGSLGNRPVNAAVTAITSTPDGAGYTLVAGDGGVFPFGDAKFLGSLGGGRLNAAIVGLAAVEVGDPPPSVAITGGPADRAAIGTARPTYSGTAADENGAVRAVQVSVDAGAYNPATCTGCATTDRAGNATSTSASVTWTFTPASGLSDGNHTFAFRALDDTGNTSDVVSRSGTIDTGAPTVTIGGGPGNGAAVGTNKPTFSGSAGDGGTGVRRVTASIDGGAASAVSCTGCGSGTGSVSWTFTAGSALSDGSHTFAFLAEDNAGNASLPQSRTITVDTVPPTVAVSAGTNPVNSLNQASVSVSGTTEPGAAVSVVVSDGAGHSTAPKTATVSGSAWSASGIDVSGLGDGTITFRATATDSAANPATASRPSTKDTVAPAAVVSLVTSPVNLANRTNVGASGTTEAGSTVSVVLADGAAHSLAPVGATVSGTTWSVSGVDSSTLSDGTLTWSATATDAAGNTGTAGTRTAVKDTVPPAAPVVVTRTSPVNLANRTTVAASGTTETGSSVSVVVSDGPHSTTPAAATVSGTGWSASGIDTTALSDGPITFSATVTDAAGNPGVAAGTATAVKDVVPPAIAVSSSTTPVNIANKANTSAAGTTEAGSSVSVVASDGGGGHSTVAAPATVTVGAWTIGGVNVTALNDGLITYTATATDAAGNPAVASRTSTKDTVAPVTVVAAFTTPVNIANHASVSGSGTTEAGSAVSVVVTDGTLTTVPKAATVTGGAWTVGGIDTSALSDGTITMKATAIDAAGNPGPAGTRLSTKDTAAPLAPTFLTKTSPVNLANRAAVGATGSTESGATVTVVVRDGVTATTAKVATLTGTTWSVSGIDATALNDGPITYSATVADAAGNPGVAAGTAPATKDVAPPAVAVLVATSPVNNANKATTSASGTTEAGATVTVVASDGAGGHSTVAAPATVTGTNWTISGVNVTALNDGTITYTATATDAALNPASAGRTATKDTVAPPAPVVTVFTSPINIANQAAVPASGTTEVGSSVSVTASDGTHPATSPVAAVVASDGTWSVHVDTSGLDDGTITLSATATDAAGNPGPAGTATSTKDTVAPAAPTFALWTSPVHLLNRTVVAASGSTESDTTVKVTVTDGTNSTTPKEATVLGTSWSVIGIDTTGLNDGTITYSAVATDQAGNPSVAGTVTATKGNGPVAVNGSLTVAANTPTGGTLTGAATGTFTYSVTGGPTHGFVTGLDASTGAYTYTPLPGFTGLDSFTFKTTAGITDSAPATISITVS